MGFAGRIGAAALTEGWPMSIFDGLGGLMKGALGGLVGAEAPALIGAALDKAGGLQGLVSTLQQNGLGEQVQSWLGDGANLPVSAEQIQAALGNQQVQDLAQKFGLPINDLLGLLSQHLPAAVDQASPNGTIDPAADPAAAS
jgi:uncharacterized protein YidB (DUF937 family)